MKLAASGLSKTFAGAPGQSAVDAVADVSLSIADGEFVSLVGPSGCGKSTLLGMLAGLITPDRGRVLVDGREPPSLLGTVGLMVQRDLLLPWRSTLRNVTLGLELAGVPRAIARERALAEFERFGLAGFEDRWPSALSGGMRQRAALLRTFLAGRDVLLLDEPFASLDALTREQMGEWLLGVWEADRKTVLLVTHDVREAVFLSDRVYVMTGRPGRLGQPVTIDLPRPRRVELTASARFGELEGQLLAPLRRAARELAWSVR